MLGPYRAVFRAPGSPAFCAAAFVMRMPLAMYALGIVLIISARNGQYGFAGVLSACYVFGNAVGGPVLSVLVDRHGQRRLLVPCAAVHAVGVISLAVLVRTSAPDALLVVPAVVFGFSYLSVGSLVRARWSYLFDGRPELSAAMSLESVLDELIFVAGPLIATVLATQAEPVLVLYLAVALVSGGSLWLAALHATEPPPHPRDGARHVSALRTRGVVLITLASVGLGAFFASLEISMVAFCGQHGQRALSGVALAAIATGSALAGFVYGAVHWRSNMLRRFKVQAAVLAVLPFCLFAATSVPVLVGCAFVLGLGIAPALITVFGLIQQLVPARALTEGLTWVSTGLNVGYGAGAAVVGGIADHHGARTAFLVVVASSVLVGVLAAVLRVDPDSLDAHTDAAPRPAEPERRPKPVRP